MKIYPILNNLGKGKYVFIFILNERAVGQNAKKEKNGVKNDKKQCCTMIFLKLPMLHFSRYCVSL